MQVSVSYCRIELLGTLRVTLPDRVITRFRTQKTALLLGYLAHHRDRAQPRETLIEMLWPDADLSAGRDSLTTALTSLRRQLEPAGVSAGSVLEADRQQVRLNPAAFTTDVAEFESLLDAPLASGQKTTRAYEDGLQRAIDLYRGAFLLGHYEDWVILEQTRLAQRYGEALQALALVREQAGNWSGALAAAHQALLTDPYRESVCRTVMRLQARLGQSSAAQETYRQLEKRLREEIHAAPGRATRELAEQLRHDPDALLSAEIDPAPPAQESVSQPEATPTPSHAVPVSLPLQTTGFFGRQSELEQLATWLQPHTSSGNYAPKRRVVTLTGPGGVGKTRLAIEASNRLASAFSGAVWFLSLAEVPHPRLLLFALANALQLRPDPSADLLEQIVARLNRVPTLLLLDNFEHLLPYEPLPMSEERKTVDSSVLVRLLLERASQLSLLITSRRILGLGGEQEFALDALTTPDQADSPECLLAYASVALYQDRAQYALPDFALTGRNAEAVARLCRKLEGMPLAIEMAAAWVKTLPPATLLERLEPRLDLLVSRRRDLPPRQRSLRATIEWSYDLLSPELRSFFAHLSVFRGGWDIEAAEAICGLPLSFCLDRLLQLQQHSLIVRDGGEGEPHYRLLETLRQFGVEKLTETGAWEGARRKHLTYFLRLAEEAERNLSGPEQGVWLARLAAEHDNFRAALLGCQGADGDVQAGLRLAAALYRFWMVRGHYREGRAHLVALLEKESASARTTERAQALNAAAVLAQHQGDYEAARTLNGESLAIRREQGDDRGVAQSLNNLGAMAFDQGDYTTARACHEESLKIKRELGDLQGTGISLNNLGLAAYGQGDYAAARTFHEESLAIKRQRGDRRGIAQALNNLGILAYEQEDMDAAWTFYTESLTIYRELGDIHGVAASLGNQGNVALSLHDYEMARALHQESLTLMRNLGDQWSIAFALGAFACLAKAAGQPERAARLWGAAEALREQIAVALSPLEQAKQALEVAATREDMEKADWETAWRTGRAMTQEQAITCALT